MIPLFFALSILWNPGGSLAYTPDTTLVFTAATFVEALGWTGAAPSNDPTLQRPFDGWTLQTVNGQDVWAFAEDAVIGHGCEAQLDLYTRDRLGADWFVNPALAVTINYAPVCIPPQEPACVVNCEPVTPPSVPEPAAFLLCGSGLCCLLHRMKRNI